MGLNQFTAVILYDAEIISPLASGSLFNLAPDSFSHNPNRLWQFVFWWGKVLQDPLVHFLPLWEWREVIFMSGQGCKVDFQGHLVYSPWLGVLSTSHERVLCAGTWLCVPCCCDDEEGCHFQGMNFVERPCRVSGGSLAPGRLGKEGKQCSHSLETGFDTLFP